MVRLNTSIVKWIVSGTACLACLLPAQQASAQLSGVRDLAGRLFDMKNFNVGINGGYGGYGRFLLENPTRSVVDFNERDLRARDAWTLGGEVGATILPRIGVQLFYSYTWSDLDWRTDNGTGSTIFDVDNVGNMTHQILGLQVIRYMFFESAKVSPFASGGVLASWWNMDDEVVTLRAPDSGTQFRWGATGTVGVQFRIKDQWRVRLDATRATIGNPFTGRDSYVSLIGRTIDEPSRVRKSNFGLGVAYAFGKPKSSLPTTNGRNGR